MRDAVVHASTGHARRTPLDRRIHPSNRWNRSGSRPRAGRGTWSADTVAGLRTFRVDRIASVAPTGEPATVPSGFDLSHAWALIADRVEELRTPVVARALVDPDALGWVAFMMGDRLRVGAATADGRVEVEARGHHLRELAADLSGFGASVEVRGTR